MVFFDDSSLVGARFGVWDPLEFLSHARVVTDIAGLAASVHYTYPDFIRRVIGRFMCVSCHYLYYWTNPDVIL